MQQLAAIANATKLTGEEKEQFAAALKAAAGISADAEANIADASAKGANTAATLSLSAATKGLIATLKGFVLAHPFLAAIAAIAATVAIVDALTVSYEESKEKLQELHQEAQTAKSELESLNSELKTTQERIKELQSKGPLSFVEKEELDNLKAQNAELERNIRLQEYAVKIATQKDNKQFLKTAQKRNLVIDAQSYNAEYDTTDHIVMDHYEAEKGYIDDVKNQLLEVRNAINDPKTDPFLLEEYKIRELDLENQLDYLDGGIDVTLEHMKSRYSELVQIMSGRSRIIDPTEQWERDYNRQYDIYQAALDRWNILINGEGAKTLAFARISTIPEFSEVKKNLEDLGKAGKVTADILNQTKYSGFVAECQASGLAIEDLIGYFNAMQAAPDLDNKGASSLKTALAGLSDETTVLRDAMAKLGEGQAAFATWAKTDDNLKSLLDKFPDLRDELEAYADALAAGEDPMRAFVSLQKAMGAALKDVAMDDAFDGIQNVVSAYEKYGANSNKVLQAVQNLEKHVPGLTNVLYDEDNALRANQKSALETVESLVDLVLATKRSALEIEKERLAALNKQLTGIEKINGDRDRFGFLKKPTLLNYDSASLIGDMGSLNSAIAETTSKINEYEQFIASVEAWAKGQNKTSNKTDPYTADVDRLYSHLQKIDDIEEDIDRLDALNGLIDEDDISAQNAGIDAMIGKLGELNAALEAANDAEDDFLRRDVNKLNKLGNFQASYDPATGRALIGNPDAVNAIRNADLNKQNELRKQANELMKDIVSRSEDSISRDLQRLKNQEKINSLMEEQQELLEKQKELLEKAQEDAVLPYRENIERLENQISLLKHQQEGDAANLLGQKSIQKLLKQRELLLEIQEQAHTAADALRELVPGIRDDDPALKEWIDKWWEAAKEIKAANEAVVDETLASYDAFLSKADDFNWWDNISTNKVTILTQKLEKIHALYKDGIIPDAETYRSLVDETAKAIYDEKISAIEQVIDYTKKLIEEEVRLRKEELEEQVDDYKKIVDLKKESLRASKDEADYQKLVAEKTKAIAKLQQQINTLSLSDDRKDIAERKKLEEELAQLQGELADAQADHTLEAQEKALDDRYEAFEQEKNDEIKKLEATIDTEGKLYQLAIDRIDAGWEALYADLIGMNSAYWDGIAGENGIKGAWDTAKQAAEGYKGTLEAIQGIEREYAAASGGNNTVANTSALDTGNYDRSSQLEVQSKLTQMTANSKEWHVAGQSRRRELEEQNRNLAAEISKLTGAELYLDDSGHWRLRSNDKILYHIYHGGTKSVGDDSRPWDLDAGEVWAKLRRNEAVVPETEVKPVMKILGWAESLAGKMMGLFSGGTNMAALRTPELISPTGLPAAITKNTGGTFAPNVNVTVQYDSSATESDVRRFGELVGDSINEAFRRKGIGAGATPLGVTI